MSTSNERVIEPAGGRPANASLILLHGLGADGNDLAPIVPAFTLPDLYTGDPTASWDFLGRKAVFYMWASW